MMMTKANYTLILFLAALFLTHCSPVYRTDYTYYPIKGRQGQMCSNTCLVAKQSCVQSEQQNYQNCVNQANFQYQMCQNAKVYAYDDDGDWVCVDNCYCYRPSCSSPKIAFCEETYKECYLNCGGEVSATTACVSNCEEAAPSRTQRLKKNEYGSIVDISAEE